MLRNTDLLFVSHGGGPRPLFQDPEHQQLIDALERYARQFERPDAILVLSAHWEAETLTVTSNPTPELYFDYYNFPEEAYQIEYPCPGSPELAQKVQACLQSAGFPTELDNERGLDHGVFVPVKLMYPDADIPVLQLSMQSSLNAEQHLAIGEALRNLDMERLLIIGSGFTFHNMRAFYAPATAEINQANVDFEDWLEQTLSTPELNYSQIRESLVNWEQAPYARFCQPREDHLIPLHVCAGIAGRSADRYSRITVFHKECSNFYWRL